MNKDFLLCGVGGQGTVLASKLIAAAYMTAGETVHSAETIGMAQRGGSVTSHVRVGSKAHSPLIGKNRADVLIAFEPAEAVRNLPYLKKEGWVIVNKVPVQPVTVSLSGTPYDADEFLDFLEKKVDHLLVVDGRTIEKALGTPRYFNVAILGAAVGTGSTGLTPELVLEEIERKVPARFVDKNKEAFSLGMEMARKG